MDIIPNTLLFSDALILIVTAGFTSFITAALGIGGGLLLIAVMASFVPIAALIPVHGLVQVGSNGSRALIMHRHIDKPMSRRFLLAALVGALIATAVVIQLPLQWLELCIAIFILYLVWGPKPSKQQLSPNGQWFAGIFTTIASMFVGATGPLVAAFIHRQNMDKLSTSATFACCMTGQHLLKLVVFSAVGFSFWQWLPLIAMMISAGFLGTWLGLKLLNRIPNTYFKPIFKLLITLLALRLLSSGAIALFA